MSAAPILVWFRIDLRIADNPALNAALGTGQPVIPVFIWAPAEESPWPPGAASQWWAHHSLTSLDGDLRKCGSRLILRRGNSLESLQEIARQTGANAVYWNRRYEPNVIARDRRIGDALRSEGFRVETFNAGLLHEPWTIANQAGKPFQVFTPFWKHCLGKPDPASPIPPPDRVLAPKRWPNSIPLADLQLLPRTRWDAGFETAWKPGESNAAKAFIGSALTHSRIMSQDGIAQIKQAPPGYLPHLHFGEISPRQIWHHLKEYRLGPASHWRNSQFLTEVGWREFAHHLLFHFPTTPEKPLRHEWEQFPWPDLNPKLLAAWQRGQTGFPIVDAGMRELWTTGWMHNRVRMIAASFLVKDLLIPWTSGARWFWDTLIDADLAANTLGWQWTAGCGADAAPYFRVFNPTRQGETFDPEGVYVRRWVPELAHLPDPFIQNPSSASTVELAQAGIQLGKTYPHPIVNHGGAKLRALFLYDQLKASRRPQ